MSEADEVIEAERAWAEAIVSNDPDAIAGYQLPEWVIVTKNGVTTGDTFLKVIRSGLLSHSRMDAVGDPLVTVFGDTAVLTVRVVSTETHAGQTIDNDEWTTTVFIRREGRWLAARTQLTTAG
jgi:ketosteroid isomerase-like protein